jgi:hypothetical protein
MTHRLLFLAAAFSLSAYSQPWSTFINSSRAIDWSSAGFTIPSYTVNCTTQPTLLTGSSNAATNTSRIQAALASCDSTHNVVNIPAGTYYVAGWTYGTQGNQVVRGAGPNSTRIYLTSTPSCGGLGGGVCMMSSDATYNGDSAVLTGSRQCSWTGGYAKGTTTITLSGCGGTPPVGKTLVLDQANDSSDTSGIYICDSSVSGCSGEDAGSYVGRNINGKYHTQAQVTHVTGVTSLGGGSYSVTISPGVYFNNIRSGQTPGAYWNGFVQYLGLENLTIDRTGYYDGMTNVMMYNTDKCWIRNVRSMYAGRNHVWLYLSSNSVIRDSYFYENQSHASESYGIEFNQSSAVLVENNIIQRVTVGPSMFGPGSGVVMAYNYVVNNGYAAPNFDASNAAHNAGNSMNLWEGNILPGINSDDSWGTNSTGTWFRNLLTGWANGKYQYTYPVSIENKSRAFNVVGNVLGQPGYQTNYESYATSNSGGVNGGDTVNHTIYVLGWSGYNGWGGCQDHTGSNVACDALVRSTLMRWGNWDVVTNGVKWDSTEASPAAVAYANANFTSSYFSSLAHTLPASLYLSSKPSWWPSGKAWPPIGPDVSSGNLGTCSGTYAGAQATSSAQCTGGTLTSRWSGTANSIPAQDCYLNVMQGAPDGTGSVLAFDASLCSTSSGGSGGGGGGSTVTIAVPTGLAATAQ